MPLLRATVGLVSVNWKEWEQQQHDGWGDLADVVSFSQHGDEEQHREGRALCMAGDEEQVIRQL